MKRMFGSFVNDLFLMSWQGYIAMTCKWAIIGWLVYGGIVQLLSRA